MKEQEKFKKGVSCISLQHVSKMSKSGRKLVMGCRKAKNAKGKGGVARNCFATPWEIFTTP